MKFCKRFLNFQATRRASTRKLLLLHERPRSFKISDQTSIGYSSPTYPCHTRAKAHGMQDPLPSLLEDAFRMTRRLLIHTKLCVFSDLDGEQVQDIGPLVESGDLHGEAPFDGC